MGTEAKYGKIITEYGEIPDDEPVFLFRASDRMLPQLLNVYGQICKHGGSPDRHLQMITDARNEILAWQHEHADEVKVPDSERSKAWLPS